MPLLLLMPDEGADSQSAHPSRCPPVRSLDGRDDGGGLKGVAGHRPTLAVLAGAVYGLVLNAGARHWPDVSETTRAWSPLARTAAASGDGAAAYVAAAEMDEARAAELLEDALDHWAAGGAEPDSLRIGDLDPQGDYTEWSDAQEAPPRTFPVTKPGLPPDHDGVARYAVLLATTRTPDGRPLPMLTLQCETAGASLVDLRRRTGWRTWDARTLPDLDVNWRLTASSATARGPSTITMGPVERTAGRRAAASSQAASSSSGV